MTAAVRRCVVGSRWRRSVGLQLGIVALIALTVGMVLATVAGARRTDTAFDRFLDESHLFDLILSVEGGEGDPSAAQLAEMRAQPTVAGLSRLQGYALEPAGTDLYQPTVAPLDDGWGRTVAVPRFLEGRAPTGPDEVSVSEHRAALLGVGIGDVLAMDSYTPTQMVAAQQGDESVFGNPTGPTLDLRVVGIERTPQTLTTDRDIATFSTLAPAFSDEHGDDVGTLFQLVVVDLVDEPGAAEELIAAVHAMPGLEQLEFEATQESSPVSDTLGFVARSLIALAIVAGLAGLVMIALLLSRLAALTSDDDAVLDALGLGRRARVRLWMLEVLPAVIVGTLLGGVGAAAASGLFPVGLGGRAEPDPGFALDGRVLVVGSIGCLLTVVVLCTIVALRAARPPARVAPAQDRPGATARLAAAGLSVPWTTGAGFVLERRGRKVGPEQLAVAAVALGSMGLVAVLAFSASQSTLYAEPELWGTTWDVALSPDDSAAAALRDEEVASRMQVRVETLEVDGRPIEVRGFEAITGPLALPVASGRPPGPNEIALGAETIRELSVDIGDDVTLGGAAGDRRLMVVGQAMLSGVTDVPVLASGGVVLEETLRQVAPPGESDGFSGELIRFAPGADVDAINERLAAAMLADGNAPDDIDRLLSGNRPDELDRLDEVRLLPWLLAAFLGTLAVTASSFLLLSAVRRRAPVLAVLRAVGLDRRGTRSIVVAQAATVSVLGLLVGIPLGAVAGRSVWRVVASDLGVTVHPAVLVALLLALAAAVVAANVGLALLPARRAARTPPGQVLRTE